MMQGKEFSAMVPESLYVAAAQVSFRPEKRLSHGGMGVVYHVVHQVDIQLPICAGVYVPP